MKLIKSALLNTQRKEWADESLERAEEQSFWMELQDISIKQVFEVVHKLNNRSKKCLGFKTPYEVFQELTGLNVKNFMVVALIT